jgi:outer membrane protein TolC
MGALALAFLSACVRNPPEVMGVPGASPAPQVPWTPPAGEARRDEKAGPAVPIEEVQEKLSALTLAEVVDIALKNNPATRAAWADARAAAAAYGSARGAYAPTVDLDGQYRRSKSLNFSGQQSDLLTTHGGTASLSYLLFDFGGRSGAVEESRQLLLSADWTQNAAIQNTVLQVQVAFFNYAAAQALLEANRTSLKEAETNLAAAEERHQVGVATIADVLQAKTARSQVKLAVQTTEGVVRTTKGALAVSMGYPANIPYDIRIGAPEIPEYGLAQTVDELIDEAMAVRPELQAARAEALASFEKVKQARSRMLPSLSLDAAGGRTWVRDIPGSADSYSAALLLHIPVFNGFSYQYDLMQARADAEASRERARGVEQQVIYQVYASHSDFLTANERVKTAQDLVASAQQSEEVALGRYKEGVGTILDLLSAQQALAQARAQQIGAKLGWFTALSQLAHDVGILGAHGENPLAPKDLAPEVKP